MYELLAELFNHVQGMWRYRWYALFVAWLVSLAGWALVFALPDLYEVRARVHVDTQSVLKPLLKGLAVDSDVHKRVSTITRTLLTRPNLERVARETDMHLRATTPNEMERLIAHLQQMIKILSPQRRNNIYEISFTDRDPQMAQAVVQVVVNALVERSLDSSREDTMIAQRFLDTEIRQYAKRLEAAEQRLADFKKKNVGMMPSEGRGYYVRLQAALDELEQTQAALRVEDNRRDELRKQLEAERRASGPILPSELANKIAEREETYKRLDRRNL